MPIELDTIKLWSKRILVIGIPLIILGVFFWIVFNYSFITINTNTEEGVQINLNGQKSGYEFSNYKSGSKKLIKKGYYNAVVTSGYSNSFTAIKQNGLLTNNEVDVTLTNKGKETIVASNPNNCSSMYADIFYSFPCGDEEETLPEDNTITKHIPATNDQPSYNETIKNYLYDDETNLGIAELNSSQNVMLVNVHSDSDDIKYIYQLRLYSGDNFTKSIDSRLIDLGKGNWTVKKYLNGLIIYSKSETKAFYLDNYQAKPVKIAFEELNEIEDLVLDLEVYGSYATYYYKAGELKNNESKKQKNMEISTINNGVGSQLINTRETYDYAFVCGDNKMCVGKNGNLIISDIDNPKRQYIIYNVSSYSVIGNNLMLSTPAGVLYYDVEKNQGNIVYSASKTEVCGISDIQGIPYICAVNKTVNKKFLIKLDLTQPKDDDILEKLAVIYKDQSVDSVSIDRNKIYISVGIISTKDENTGKYENNQEEFNFYSQRIENLITEAGIDRNKYQITIL